MKTLKIITIFALILCAGTLIMVSCKKKAKEEDTSTITTGSTDTDDSSANDNNVAENSANDMESMGSQASENGGLTTFRSSGESGGLMEAGCAVVTADLAIKTITIDFGTSCTGADGRVRSGKLIYTYSLSTNNAVFYRNPGFNLLMTPVNYVVDGYSVTNGSNHMVTNTTPSSIPTGTNPGTNLSWSVSATFTITKPDGKNFTWTCTRTKVLTNTSDPVCYHGQSTAISWDKAIVKISGSATGTNAAGEVFTNTLTEVVRDFNCNVGGRRPFINGTLDHKPGTKLNRHVDYAYPNNGACDNKALLTITNGATTYTKELVLP